MNERTFWLSLWIALAAIFATIIIACVTISAKHDEKMAELGYQEVLLTGSEHTYWQKASN